MSLDFSEYTVLIVDDEAPFRKMIRTLLEKKLKVMVYEASNPIEAFSILSKIKASLIIMNMEMPEMDGLTAIRKLHNNKGTMDIPIIAFSALRVPELIVSLAKLNIADFIAKPSDTETILVKVATVLDKLKNKELTPEDPQNVG